MLQLLRKLTWRERLEVVCEMIVTLVTGVLGGYWWCHLSGGTSCWPF